MKNTHKIAFKGRGEGVWKFHVGRFSDLPLVKVMCAKFYQARTKTVDMYTIHTGRHYSFYKYRDIDLRH